MFRGLSKKRLELSRELVLPVLFLSLLVTPWFIGGRDSFGLVVQAGLSLLLLVSWVLLSRDRALSVSWKPHWVVIPATVLVGLSLVSLIWSVSRFETTVMLVTILSAATAFVVSRDVFRSPRARNFFKIIFLLISGVISTIGIGMFIVGDYDRATSLFFWPNPLATFLLAAIPFSLDLAIRRTDQKPSVWVYWTLLIGTAFGLTYSRAAWLIGVAVMLLVIWRSADRRRAVIVSISVVFASAALVLAFSSARTLLDKPTISVAERLTESVKSQSVSDRFDYWREGTAMFAERPILGWGSGTYKQVHPQFQRSAITAGNNPHSLAVQVLVELGAFGFIALLVMFAGFAMYLYKERNSERSPAVWSARIAVVAIILHALLDLVTNYPVLIVLLTILLAMAMPMGKDHVDFRLKNRIALVAIGLGLAANLYATWFAYQLYLARIDQAYIDVLVPIQTDEAGSRYDALSAASIVPPSTLSQAALFWVDIYDSQDVPDQALVKKAVTLATEATRREPQDARHWYALANANERLGKTSEALSAYRRAVDLDPYNNPQYQVSYARLLAQEGFTREALEVLFRITTEYSDEVIANRNFVRIADRVAIALTLQAKLQLEAGDKIGAAQSVARARLLSPKYQPAIDFENSLR
jgi:O-antigen ligase